METIILYQNEKQFSIQITVNKELKTIRLSDECSTTTINISDWDLVKTVLLKDKSISHDNFSIEKSENYFKINYNSIYLYYKNVTEFIAIIDKQLKEELIIESKTIDNIESKTIDKYEKMSDDELESMSDLYWHEYRKIDAVIKIRELRNVFKEDNKNEN
jgi:hypothetical protein